MPVQCTTTRERGRPARNHILASSLPFTANPLRRAPNLPSRSSFRYCQVVCGRDARAPGRVPPETMYSCKQPAIHGQSLAKRSRSRPCRVRFALAGSISWRDARAIELGPARNAYSCKQPAIRRPFPWISAPGGLFSFPCAIRCKPLSNFAQRLGGRIVFLRVASWMTLRFRGWDFPPGRSASRLLLAVCGWLLPFGPGGTGLRRYWRECPPCRDRSPTGSDTDGVPPGIACV